jgi:hypothetical protein
VNPIIFIHVQILRTYILVLQNSLKSPFLPSQFLYNFLGIFPQIFLPPESLYSISNPILIQKSIKIDFSFYSFGFQPEQRFRPVLLPSFPAQPWPTSSLPFRPSRPVASPSLIGGPNLSVSPAVFFLREPDRAPPPVHLPRADPLPLPWQNESAPLPAHLPDSPFCLPISSPTRNAFTIEAPPAAADSSPPSL